MTDAVVCYPPPERFAEAFGEAELREWLAKRSVGGLNLPLALGFHLPEHAPASQYIKYLVRHLALAAPLLGAAPGVCAMLWSPPGAPPADDVRRALEVAVEAALGKAPGAAARPPRPEYDLLAIGPAAIGRIGPAAYQNLRDLAAYCAALDAGRLPVERGLVLDADDLVRRAVMQALFYERRVSIESIELAHLVDFRRYFAGELHELRQLAREGLVELAPDWIILTDSGQARVGTVSGVFDRYAREARERAAYTRAV